ncbi:Uncharacterised protein [Yersinia kristensenii]|nr:Uncharacterised protein [Yersinia kristensenii]
MFTKHGLKQNKKKMKIESIQNKKDGFQVTGLWVGHAEPKTRRDERRYIRLMVYVCEKEYPNSMSTESYHELWNKTSGLVAKLNRLNQSNYKSLRERLGAVLPLYNDSERDKIIRECKSLLKLDSSKPVSYGQLDSINKIYSRLGILARNNTNLSRSWRKKLRSHFRKLPTKKEIWL